jgi:hypothetical protein
MSSVLDILRKYQKKGGLPDFKDFKESILSSSKSGSSNDNMEFTGGGRGGGGGGRGGRGGRGGGGGVGRGGGGASSQSATASSSSLHASSSSSDAPKFSRDQLGPLELRIKLLESLIEESTENAHFPRYNVADVFSDGDSMVVVDLTDPMMSAPEANSIFQVLLSKFITTDLPNRGKMIVLDEAHKYISPYSNDELGQVNI